MGRKFITRFDLLKLKVASTVAKKEEERKEYFHGNRIVEFELNGPVMAKMEES